ncbi:hypothetical protein F5Y19DRAFT_417784 [Xylariaceae sp. FL1651]|nr:hypothetical protein F5Y19DRAFT_417784 [Xylariaceae sp. FL1651]
MDGWMKNWRLRWVKVNKQLLRIYFSICFLVPAHSSRLLVFKFPVSTNCRTMRQMRYELWGSARRSTTRSVIEYLENRGGI